MTFNKITLFGGGVLGSQIAFMTALHGKETMVYGRSYKSIERVQTKISQWKEAAKKDLNLSDENLEMADNNLSYTTDFDKAIKGRDLVIEALPEDKKVKNEFFANFDKVADENTILATNTSTFLPSEFAEMTGRPDKFLAYHFANNIWKNNTAEIMAQSKTNPDLLSDFEQLSREIGMVPITINKEQPGYILNSLLVPFENAAFSLWINGVSSPQDIDKTWMIATGSPLGPFAIADIIGMHTNYEITSQNEALQDVAAKFKEMIDADKLGRENGKGFYNYPNPAYEQPDFLK